LPSGDAIAREIASHGHDVASIVVPADPVLADDALAALVIAAALDPSAGYDGAWHHQWDDEQTELARERRLPANWYHRLYADPSYLSRVR
jgi:hypothetical protein